MIRVIFFIIISFIVNPASVSAGTGIPVSVSQQSNSGVFKGKWKYKDKYGDTGVLTLDFYGKTIRNTGDETDKRKYYGSICILEYTADSSRPDDCMITSRKISGNKATVTFIGGRDLNTYTAVLTYSPNTGKITISGVKCIESEGIEETLVSDGMVFGKVK